MKYRLDRFINVLAPEVRIFAMNKLVRFAPNSAMRLTERLFDLPISDVVRNSPSLFIHIPKNAGTTVNNALYGRFVGHRTALWYRRADREFFDTKYKFSIMRDPVERFISAFFFLQAGGTSLVHASPQARRFVQGYKSIVEFIADVESKSLIFKKMDLVFHNQCDYIADDKQRIMIDKVYVLSAIAGTQIAVPGASIDMTVITNSSEKPRLAGPDMDVVVAFVSKHYAEDIKIITDLSKSWE
jgi:hypothetical protein